MLMLLHPGLTSLQFYIILMETQKILGTLLKYWCGIEKTVHVFKRDRFHVLFRNLRKGKTCKVSSGAKNVNRFSPQKIQSLREAVVCVASKCECVLNCNIIKPNTHAQGFLPKVHSTYF